MTCPHCGHDLPPEYRKANLTRHTFNNVLLSALQKFAQGVGRKGKNEIHLRRDLALSTDELNNFTKVRFFGLVAKARNPDGSRKRGYWLLTRRGSRFLKGHETLSRAVETMNNRVVGHSEERISAGDSGLPPIDLSYEILDGEIFTPLARQSTITLPS